MSARAIVLALVVAAVTVLSIGVASIGAPHLSAPTSATTASHAAASLEKASSTSNAPSVSSREALEQQILQTSSADHIPLAAVSLPNLLGQATITNGVVSPLTTIAPAPMGIGTDGVLNTTGTPTAYTIETDSWEGSITLTKVNSFWLDNDGALSTSGTNNTFGVQLNTVTVNSTVGQTHNNSFWTQNVFYWDLIPGYITFLDNVWNFSSPATALTSGTIYSGNGTPVYPEYYYAFGPSVPVTLPVTVHLYINSSTTDLSGIGYTTVRFGYDVVNGVSGLSEASGIYDTVLFNSSTPYAQVPASPFLVSGSQLTPTNFLLYDAEIMIGGPGGGTTTSMYALGGSESLQYWNANDHAYVNPPSAWNVASDTGETSEGVAETYTTPGTVQLSAGPSIPAPFWNATPGGNIGQTTFSGPLSPSNAFVFFSPGSTFNAGSSAWAPTQTASSVDYVLPPGTYTVEAMLSDYAPITTTATGHNGGTVALRFDLTKSTSEGVYTPLDAWNNAQLAAISSGGSGSASSPYTLFNNAAKGGINQAFSEVNDYLYPVFPGLLIAGTTAHAELEDSQTFGVTYPARLDASLSGLDLPNTNHLQFEIYEASNFTLWHTVGITGWLFFEDYGPTGELPFANVVVFQSSHVLIGDNTFVSQGSSLLLADIDPSVPTGNVVWGNTFVNSSQLTPTMYPGDGAQNGPPIAIFSFEAGDLIYNNYVDTSITAYVPDVNMFYGFGQLNLENWNLSMVEPRGYSVSFNGFDLTGTIVPSEYQGGNYWADYDAAYGLPYDEYGYIESGGDYFPLPIVAYEVEFELSHGSARVDWTVTINGVTQATTGSDLVFYEVPGTYSYTDSVVSGSGSIAPSSGTVTVSHANVVVHLTWVGPSHPGRSPHTLPPVADRLATPVVAAK
jgi:thermopsin